MATIYHKGTTVAGIFKIGISWNTKCDNLVGFPKSGHIYKAMNDIALTTIKHKNAIVSLLKSMTESTWFCNNISNN